MVSQQVITFQPDGTVSGLQMKKGRGLDLRSLGKASIVRASEIVWNEDRQGWHVQIMDAPGMEAIKGVQVTAKMIDTAGLGDKANAMINADKAQRPADADTAVLFFDYEDAVEMEIAFLDAWRLRGRY